MVIDGGLQITNTPYYKGDLQGNKLWYQRVCTQAEIST